MKSNYDYIIVGAGVSGLALAKELYKKNKKTLILEAGKKIRKLGSVIRAAKFYDNFALSKSKEGTIIYRAFGVGGTSIVSGGNAVEPSSEEIKQIGINFKEELNEAKKECSVGVSSFPVGKVSKRIMEVSNELGYNTRIMPKFGAVGRCVSCGRCFEGCKYNAKWTASEFLNGIVVKKNFFELVQNFSVHKILIEKGKAIGVQGNDLVFGKKKFYANKIILSAGGLGTPRILQMSNVRAGEKLFVDLFNVTYGFCEEVTNSYELTMSVVCDEFHENEGFLISPLVDNFWGFSTSVVLRDIYKTFRLKKMVGIMTKIRDENIGRVLVNGKIEKNPTRDDLEKLKKGTNIAKRILEKMGADSKRFVITRPRGAHPGGTAPVGGVVDQSLETRIKNLFICDASILPRAIGIPPMLMLVAISKWFANNILEKSTH